jgi:tripartite-type tricarboxylate transporter receptor subunit TctC
VVRIIVPFNAGGGNDTAARAVGERLSKKWGQPVVIENRPGAGTAIGTRAVIESPPDGHTLLFTSSTPLVVNPHTRKLPFDPLKELAPIAIAVSGSPAMAVSSSTPAKTLQELIAYAKKNPGKLAYASTGKGTYPHVAMEYFAKRAGIDMLHVPYTGTAPILTDMLGGRINVYMVSISVFQQLEKDGKLKIIAMGTADKLPSRPDLPTIGSELPGYEIDVWFGFAAPNGTPDAILDKINKDVIEVVNDPKFVKEFAEPRGFIPSKLNRKEFLARMKKDYDTWGKMATEVGLTKK